MNGIKDYYINFPQGNNITFSYLIYLYENKNIDICFNHLQDLVFINCINNCEELETRYNNKKIGDVIFNAMPIIENYGYFGLFLTRIENEEEIEYINNNNSLIPYKNILYNKYFLNKLEDCKYDYYFISVDELNGENKEYKDLNLDFYINNGHSIGILFDFICKKIFIIGSNSIRTQETFKGFVKNILPKYKDYKIISDFNEYCPNFNNIEGLLIYPDEEIKDKQKGLCVVWKLYILKQWLLRENQSCDDNFMEFQKKISTPDINDKEFVKYIDNSNLIIEPELKEYDISENTKYIALWLKYQMEKFLGGIMKYRNELNDKLSDEEKEYNELRIEREKILKKYIRNLSKFEPESEVNQDLLQKILSLDDKLADIYGRSLYKKF